MTKKQELATTTKLASLETLHPDVLGRELVQIRTIADALAVSDQDKNKYPSLIALKRDYGDKKIEAIIKLHLIELCENVNLRRPLKDIQSDNIAREVVATYGNLTIADIHVIFRKALTGEYGEFYESLDMPKVMSWFRDYFDERCEIAAAMSQRHGYYDKGGNMTSERMTKHFNELERKFKKGIK